MWLRYALCGLLSFGLPGLAPGQTTPINPCEPPDLIEAAIRQAGKVETERGGQPRPHTEVEQEWQEHFKELLAEHPEDFWVLRAYIDAMKSGVASDELIAQFHKRYQNSKENPQAAYLYAHALTGKNTPKAIEILTPLVETAPSFPWPPADLAHIYNSPNFNDAAKRKRFAESFMDRCPATREAVDMARWLAKSDKLVAFTHALRERIAGKADENTVPLYRSLWTLEFKLTPLNEQAPLRERVAKDLQFLESLDKQKFKSLRSVLREGYELTGNKEAADRLAAEAQTPEDKLQAFYQANQAWSKANPYPRDNDPDTRKAYFQKRLQFLDEWFPQLPDAVFLHVNRLGALSEISDTSDSLLVAEGEKALEAAAKRPGHGITDAPILPTTMQVAEIWARKGLQLERVPALVREGMDAWEEDQQVISSLTSDLNDGPDRKLREENSRWQMQTAAWRILVMAYAAGRKSAEARSVLANWEKALAERRDRAEQIRRKRETETAQPAAASRSSGPDRVRSQEDTIVRSLPFAESQYNEALAELALAENRKVDALAFYQAGLRAQSAADRASDLTKSEMGHKASALWKELGGTQEGWQSWLDSLKEISPSKQLERSRWMAMNRALPELSLPDQRGQTWTLARVRGKATIINIWATWCGPCRSELPYLQQLYDKIKAREDVQVITFNIDDNSGLVQPFLTENKYTFPVLIAKSFVDAFVGPLGIPANWISDRDASLRLEAVGFDGNGDEWIKDTLEQVEKICEGKILARPN